MSYIVIVTGERDWTDRETVYRVLDEELGEFMDATGGGLPSSERTREMFVVRHGVAAGADFIANDWGKERGVTIERFHADWNPPGGYDSAAGPKRNLKMARTEPRADKCVAFWSGQMRRRTNGREYSGTLDMIKTALQHQIPVRVTPPRTP